MIPIDFCWRWPSVALFLGGITIVLLDGLPWRLALSGQTRAKAERSEDDRLFAQIRESPRGSPERRIRIEEL